MHDEIFDIAGLLAHVLAAAAIKNPADGARFAQQMFEAWNPFFGLSPEENERAIREFVLPRGAVDTVYASGGGVRNVTLMTALRRRLEDISLSRLDELGVSPDTKEALAFAFLAHLTLCGAPGNVPGATGARHPVVLGSITPGGFAGASRS